MKQRMRYLVLVALAASTTLIGACSDDEDSIDDTGGSAGASGSKTAGSSAGGSANKAGNNSGGKAGNATAGTSTAGTSTAGASANAGAGGAGEGGLGGATDGGAVGNSAGAGGSDGGAAGAGGAAEPALVYKCGSSTLIRKKCSALAAAECEDPTICSDCVDLATADREAFQNDPPCPACNAKYDAFDQCMVDAFESGDLAFGVECIPGYGADGSESCYPFLDEAIACQGYVGSDQDPHECPATWPPQ